MAFFNQARMHDDAQVDVQDGTAAHLTARDVRQGSSPVTISQSTTPKLQRAGVPVKTIQHF